MSLESLFYNRNPTLLPRELLLLSIRKNEELKSILIKNDILVSELLSY